MSVSLEQFRDGDRLIVGCSKLSNQDKIQLIQKIVSVLDGSNKKYLIEICGLGVTIDTFIEEMRSKNYLYFDESKGRFFPRKLDKLYLLTENEQDLYSATEYFGSFNEGYISISFLDTNEDLNIAESAENVIEGYVLKNCLLEILVEPDGEFMDIRARNESVSMSEISNAISQLTF
jgi:hypothetical protein